MLGGEEGWLAVVTILKCCLIAIPLGPVGPRRSAKLCCRPIGPCTPGSGPMKPQLAPISPDQACTGHKHHDQVPCDVIRPSHPCTTPTQPCILRLDPGTTHWPHLALCTGIRPHAPGLGPITPTWPCIWGLGPASPPAQPHTPGAGP